MVAVTSYGALPEAPAKVRGRGVGARGELVDRGSARVRLRR